MNKYFNSLIKEIKDFSVRSLKFSKIENIYTKFIVINDYKYIIVYN